VSHKPGSQTFPHAAQNIKEETGNSATDLAKTISGNVAIPDTLEPGRESFVGILRSIQPNIMLNASLAWDHQLDRVQGTTAYS